MTHSMAQVYARGLQDLLQNGRPVPSVKGAKSKASNFGKGDRPWTELIAYQFVATNDCPQIITSSLFPVHIPYTIGLLSWTLDARHDVHSLAYYRRAAHDYSDDGETMCGAFGARLFGLSHKRDQISSIAERLSQDPSSRRTYASIIEPTDNVTETLEYPCAAGVQVFLRDSRLHWLTVMRAQQALTVLPYDMALFSMMQHFFASSLNVAVGNYYHFAGTFHIYDNEKGLATALASGEASTRVLPNLPPGAGIDAASELIGLESDIRTAALAADTATLDRIAARRLDFEFNVAAREILVDFARTKV